MRQQQHRTQQPYQRRSRRRQKKEEKENKEENKQEKEKNEKSAEVKDSTAVERSSDPCASESSDSSVSEPIPRSDIFFFNAQPSYVSALVSLVAFNFYAPSRLVSFLSLSIFRLLIDDFGS
eukprot:g12422.t1